MPRRRRMYLPGYPVHLVQRGHNRSPCFRAPEDYREYLVWLETKSIRFEVAVHAWCLMTNHVHLLITPREEDSVPRMLQHLGRCYVAYFNRKYGRTGTLWEGRSKASLVQDRSYLLNTYRYIELNPVRAGIVERPEQYPWSSYRTNALGRSSTLVTFHDEYLQLGVSPEIRQAAYRALTSLALAEPELDRIRQCNRHDMPYGNADFCQAIEVNLGRAIGQAANGRPHIRKSDH